MKANAPEKNYVADTTFPDYVDFDGSPINTKRIDEHDIEYTRTNAFIEKACEWIREFNNHHYIMRYSDSCEPPLGEVTEWFKNYMKGE